MARFPVALWAYGQPPRPPADASTVVTPRRSATSVFASACPYVSWKCTAIRAVGIPAATSASSSAATRPGVATPIVSPMLSSVQPSAISFAATATTCAGVTSPSHGSPKHIDR